MLGELYGYLVDYRDISSYRF